MRYDQFRSIGIFSVVPSIHGRGQSVPDIGQLKQRGDVSSLISLLNNPDPSVGWRAAEALGTCGAMAVPPLIRAARSPSALVRIGAIEALAAIRDPRALDSLTRIARRDRLLEVRWAAVLALGELGVPEAVPVLVPLLRDASPYLRYGAATALDRAGWQPGDIGDQVYLMIGRQDWTGIRKYGTDALLPLRDLLRDADEKSREEIVSVLREIGDPQACGSCRNALKDRNPRVRWKAVLAAIDCGLASHEIPLTVAGRERTGPDPVAAAVLNFLFLGIGYNYIGKWWGFPVFITYMFIIFLAQFIFAELSYPPVLALVIAYPVTALLGIHTYYLAERMSDEEM